MKHKTTKYGIRRLDIVGVKRNAERYMFCFVRVRHVRMRDGEAAGPCTALGSDAQTVSLCPRSADDKSHFQQVRSGKLQNTFAWASGFRPFLHLEISFIPCDQLNVAHVGILGHGTL